MVEYLIETYEAPDGWRWRCVAPNGRIVATGAEAYSTKSNCSAAVDRFLEAGLAKADD